MGKLHLYYGTVKSSAGGRRIMAWARSREHALDLVEAALTVNEPVLGSVVGPLTSVRDDVMVPGVFAEATPSPKPPQAPGTPKAASAPEAPSPKPSAAKSQPV
ncbi:MAG TPA: hypothetical protein VGG75_04380 [Trebonia sp.]